MVARKSRVTQAFCGRDKNDIFMMLRDGTNVRLCCFGVINDNNNNNNNNNNNLGARLVKCLVTAEKGRSFSSGCRSQSSVLMRPCSTSHSLGTTIRTSSHSTFAFDFFLCFQPLDLYYQVGCVAQLAERRSLAGELTLSCARPSEDG